MVSLFLLLLALVMFVLATVGLPAPPRFAFLPAGLAFWVLSLLVTSFPALR